MAWLLSYVLISATFLSVLLGLVCFIVARWCLGFRQRAVWWAVRIVFAAVELLLLAGLICGVLLLTGVLTFPADNSIFYKFFSRLDNGVELILDCIGPFVGILAAFRAARPRE